MCAGRRIVSETPDGKIMLIDGGDISSSRYLPRDIAAAPTQIRGRSTASW